MRKITNEELHRLSPEEFAEAPKINVEVVLDNIRSLNNVGSFFRTADAFAVRRLHLCGITAVPPNRDIHKTALGAENTVTWKYWKSTVECIASLREQGFTILAVEQVEGAVPADKWQLEPTERYALVFGNEVFGVDQAAVDACDGAIEIPQSGTKHSLNVAVSGGVILWEAYRQLHTALGE